MITVDRDDIFGNHFNLFFFKFGFRSIFAKTTKKDLDFDSVEVKGEVKMVSSGGP